MNREHWYSEMYRKMAGCLDDGGSSGLFIRRRREPEAVSSFNGAMAYYPVIALKLKLKVEHFS